MSVSLTALWMPIVLGGILTWLASIIMHMLLPHHKSDYLELENEPAVADALGKGSPKPGMYTLPHCTDMKEMGEQSTIEKFDKGPVAIVTVYPNGTPPMGKYIAQQITFCFLSCLLIGYCASLALAPGTDYRVVFRTVCTVGFLTFGWGQIPFSIWYGHPWSTTFKYLFDALVYGLIAAGVFGWLWPAVA